MRLHEPIRPARGAHPVADQDLAADQARILTPVADAHLHLDAGRIRGRAIPLDGRYVFPTLSLSRALYTPADRALLISDFSRLPELLEAERPSTYETLNVTRSAEPEPLQPGLW